MFYDMARDTEPYIRKQPTQGKINIPFNPEFL